MNYAIKGVSYPSLVITLERGERLYVEPDMVLEKSPQISVRRKIDGEILFAIKRKLLTGGSLFLEECVAESSDVSVRLGARRAGHIVPIRLYGQAILCRRDSFVAFYGDMDLDVVFAITSGTKFFRGKNFVLQKISGSGTAFIYADSYIVEDAKKMRFLLKEKISLFGAPVKGAT